MPAIIVSDRNVARQHNVAEVACYRLERTPMAVLPTPRHGGVGALHHCRRVSKNKIK